MIFRATRRFNPLLLFCLLSGLISCRSPQATTSSGLQPSEQVELRSAPAGATANDAITWYAKGLGAGQTIDVEHLARDTARVRVIVGKLMGDPLTQVTRGVTGATTILI